MFDTDINNENSVFSLLSFEGPDIYSLAGGLGVRISNLAKTLADNGYATHLFFIGDPRKKGEEVSHDCKLTLHRWCQWISAYWSAGVYQGEEQKLSDFNQSIPGFLWEQIISPALHQGKIPVILAEEWQTAEVVCRINDLLTKFGVRDKVVIFWNANNVFGFERINWKRLADSCTLTTVSRYMKHVMWRTGTNPLVIPNGIPKFLLNKVDTSLSANLRKNLGFKVVLSKIARWDPDKRWHMAVESIARLKSRGVRTALLARGGLEPFGSEVFGHAKALGLVVRDTSPHITSMNDYFNAIAVKDADIINMKFHCPQEFLRIVYHASDAVLANSGREPFGLVGLETMAAGGIAFTGNTGEDYAIPFHNAVVLETSNPKEIETHVLRLLAYPEEAERMRKAAKATASRFTWDQVIFNLIHKLEYQARIQGCLALPVSIQVPEKSFEYTQTAQPSEPVIIG